MAILEREIGVVIPTYRYKEKVCIAVRSALESGAGEVIVVDDSSKDGTIDALSGFRDPRLKLFENRNNLGLWENHLEALGKAKCRWIKFLQADDYLQPGGLEQFAVHADDNCAVIWCVPLIKKDDAEAVPNSNLRNPRRISATELFDACMFRGWLLGSPSHMMLRSDVIEREPTIWRREMSADLVVGAIAATRGDILLIPAGPIIHCEHEFQDAKTQGYLLSLRRLVNSIQYLSESGQSDLARFSVLWGAVSLPVAIRSAAAGTWKREASPVELLSALLQIAVELRRLPTGYCKDLGLLLKAAAFRRKYANQTVDLDFILNLVTREAN